MSKKMLKFIFVFMALFVNSVMAQVDNEALLNIESRIEKFEELSRTLTSQMEENGYNNKVRNEKMENLVKSIDLSVENLKKGSLEYKNRMNEIEKSNTQLQKEIEVLRKSLSNVEDFIKTIPTKEPFSLVDNKEENVENNKNEQSEELLVQNPEIVKDMITDLGLSQKAPDEDLENSYILAKKKYEEKNFTDSAIEFADIIKKYPDSKWFHPSLLYLGLSMKELGKVNNACQAFANIINSKEEVEGNVKKSAGEEFVKLGCMNLNKKNGK